MNKIFLTIISFFAAALLSSAAFGGEAVKDAVIADPDRYTVEFENDKVRVIRIKYGPGEKSVMHSHEQHVAVFLSENLTRMTLPDGTSQEGTSEFGTTQWSDKEVHLPENLSDEPLELVLVEIK